MNDTELVKAAQSGSGRAFECLLTEYYDTIYRFALKWSGNRDDAEDIAQQVCIKLVRVLPQFRFEASFSSWLYRIVINTAKDWRSKEKRHADTADISDVEHAVAGNEEPVILLHQLLEKVAAWGEGFKETLLLVHGEGLTHGEAARVLGVKESTISWRLHEIRKKLALLSIENS